jgi:hypothetical protein
LYIGEPAHIEISLIRKHKTYPATPQSVYIRTTDAAVRDFDINIGLLPLFRLEFLPDHLALGGTRVETHPAFEFVVCLRHDVD